MDLLQNAIASIEMGVEDYDSKDQRRVLSALRNLYSGLLLLLKEVLVREFPGGSGLLIYPKLLPVRVDNDIKWKPATTNNTVNLKEIQERFKSLELSLDWKPVEALQKLRNDVEHHAPKKDRDYSIAALGSSFPVIKQIIEGHLRDRPERLLSKESWARMMKAQEFYGALQADCQKSIEDLDNVPNAALPVLAAIKCMACDSGLLCAQGGEYTEAVFDCKTCGHENDIAGLVLEAVHSVYGRDYEKKIGWVDSVERCHYCHEEAYVLDAEICLLCCESRPYRECLNCEESLTYDESDISVCGFCRRDRDD